MAVLENTTTSFARLLTPIRPFDSPALPNISTLDILGALRLSAILRQLRRQNSGNVAGLPKGSWWHDLVMTMVIVFGGEMVVAAMLTIPPSFMISPTVPLLFVGSHILANALPDALIPNLDLQSELPLSLLDAATRSMLVCDGVASLIKTNPNPLLRTSPMALLITSTVLGNGGFFFVNLFGMLSPSGWMVSTPPELGPYGWTTTDLWVAPAMSALFATLTHLQPFWIEVQRAALSFLGEQSFTKGSAFKMGQGVLEPVDPAVARSICALIMGALFTSRAVKNFWGPAVEKAKLNAKAAPKKRAVTPAAPIKMKKEY